MKRLLALVVIASIGHASAAVAGESILTSGARHVQQLAAAETAKTPPPSAARLPAKSVTTVARPPAASYEQEGSNLSKSGMRNRTKVMLFAGLAAGFVGSIWAIDHHVLDITPSSLGTRED